MTVETYEVVLSFDQPGNAQNPLLSILQQLLDRTRLKDSRAAALLGARKILVIDSFQDRAKYVAQLLASARYQPFVVPTSLDAYTLFLQGTFQPFVIILSGEGSATNRLFLTRLSQQYLQRYDWNIPFIRLSMPTNNQAELRSTGPLGQSQQTPLRSTLPLTHSGDLPRQAPSASSFRQSGKLPPAETRTSQPLPIPSAPLPPVTPSLSSTDNPASSPPVHPPTPLLKMPKAPALTPLPDPPQASGPISLVFQQPLVSPSSNFFKGSEKLGIQTEKVSLNGLSIGRYHLQSVIGSNPIGDVYLTYDRLREQHIALKAIQTDMIPAHLMNFLHDGNENPFQRELDLLQRIEHPHLSRVMSGGKSYIGNCQFAYKTMPHYPEGSLNIWLNQTLNKTFTPVEVARIILQLADGIQYLHERGVLYRNFKMNNILIVNETRNISDLHVVLADLPFVQDVISLPKNPESYRYTAPEQWDGEDFTSSDQYGLAVIAYELLTGRAPFQGNSDGIIRRMQLKMVPQVPSVFNPRVPSFVDKVILRALSRRPAERFDSVAAFASTFERSSL